MDLQTKNRQEIEEEREWTPLKIIAAILLFPLLPFLLIYRLKINKRIRYVLMIVYFVLLMAIYQVACIKQGPVIKSITLYEKEVTLKLGDTYSIDYTAKPTDVKVEEIKYTSSDKSVAKVNKEGQLSTITAGNCKITVAVTDNHHTTKQKTLKVHVVE